MQVNTYWNHGVAATQADGVALTSVYGPVGSIAIGGGGWASPATDNSSNNVPMFPLIMTKPDPDSSNGWIVGFAGGAPNALAVKLHCYVVCLEDLPE